LEWPYAVFEEIAAAFSGRNVSGSKGKTGKVIMNGMLRKKKGEIR